MARRCVRACASVRACVCCECVHVCARDRACLREQSSEKLGVLKSLFKAVILEADGSKSARICTGPG